MLLHGAGNGILTITKGSLPLAIFGPQALLFSTALSLAALGALHVLQHLTMRKTT